MNSNDQSTIPQPAGPDIEKLSQALHAISANFPTQISKAVFASSLFHSRSEYMADYQAEIHANLIKLSELVSTGAQYQWLYERCEAQIMAFVQVAMRNQKQVKRATATGSSASLGAQVQLSHRQHLQQELVKHHDYERRLKDNLYKAQAEAQISGEHHQVIACQQRLIRCQQAIEKIERQLEV